MTPPTPARGATEPETPGWVSRPRRRRQRGAPARLLADQPRQLIERRLDMLLAFHRPYRHQALDPTAQRRSTFLFLRAIPRAENPSDPRSYRSPSAAARRRCAPPQTARRLWATTHHPSTSSSGSSRSDSVWSRLQIPHGARRRGRTPVFVQKDACGETLPLVPIVTYGLHLNQRCWILWTSLFGSMRVQYSCHLFAHNPTNCSPTVRKLSYSRGFGI